MSKKEHSELTPKKTSWNTNSLRENKACCRNAFLSRIIIETCSIESSFLSSFLKFSLLLSLQVLSLSNTTFPGVTALIGSEPDSLPSGSKLQLKICLVSGTLQYLPSCQTPHD